MDLVTLAGSLISDIGGNVTLGILGALLSLATAYVVQRTFLSSKLVALLLTLFTAIVAAVLSFFCLASPADHLPSTLVLIFLTSVVLWAVCFHVFAANFGYRIRQINAGWCSVFFNNWVKALDYIYLTISAFSVLRILMTAVIAGNGIAYVNAFATVLLGLAVALRLTRTSTEIFGWDRPRQPAA